MGIEDIVKQIKPKVEQEVIDKPKEEVETQSKKGVMGGPEAYEIIEWNRQTMKMFHKNKKPRQGRKYCLKCIRDDGKRLYFALAQI